MITNIVALRGLFAKTTPGKWILATSCSWRRVLTEDGLPVIVPTVSRADNHPDIMGGEENLDAVVAAHNALPAILYELEAARAVVEAAKLLANLEGDPLAYFNSMTEALAAYEEACNG